MNKLKIAIIGAGNIGKVHISAYSRIPEAEVVAICDINEKVLNSTADEFGIQKRYTSIEELLKNEKKIDAADVCVWNCNHAKCAIQALNGGLHVLCEKPMAYTAEEAIEMKKCAEKNGKLLMIGFVTRFSKSAVIVKDFIDKGYIGNAYYARAQYVRRHGNPGGWFSDMHLSGGGPMMDIGVHVIDRARWLMGLHKPVSVYAATFNELGGRWAEIKNDVDYRPAGSTDYDLCDVEDFATAIIRFENNSVIQIEASFDINMPEYNGMIICGDKGGIKEDETPIIYTNVNGHLADIAVNARNYKTESGKLDTDFFTREIQHFVDCILGRCECISTADDGIVMMQIIDAIYKSAKMGHEIIIEQE